MKKARLFCTILLIGIVSMSMVTGMETLSLSNVSDKITNELIKEGHRIEEVSFEKDTITSTFATTTTSDSIGPNEILALRAISNEVRALALKDEGALRGVKSVKQIIKNSDDEIIYENDIINLRTICEDFEDSMQLKNGSIKHSKKETKQLLEETFEELGISVNVSEVKESNLVGYSVALEIINHNNDIDMINSTIRQIDSAMIQLNIDGAMIGEFILSVTDVNDSNEIIYLMAADLMYREFLWWQSPEHLGRSSWRH